MIKNKWLLTGVPVLLVLGYVMNQREPAPPQSMNAREGSSAQIIPMSEQDPKAAKPQNLAEIQRQREIFRDEAALGVMHLKPKIHKNKLSFSIRYAPIERSCVNGDIDLIQRSVGEKHNLHWSFEDQNGRPVAAKREVSMKQLDAPFTQNLELPVTAEGRYYRLALCLNPNQADCAETKAIDYGKLERRDRNIELRSGLFFTQYFRVDATGVHIFDSRELKDAERYKKWAKKMDGNEASAEFFDTMLEQQKTLGSLPVELRKDSVLIHLFKRSNKGC